ncbi:MAG: gamma-glutamyl-gamma-aminobutyrate hydrolase family protein [Ruminococcaceae bacterium]|nr:gamma-glutamyl-gamma-aminobutyrate hydrolase family protein [Oscillospiraceae bacterium]
MTDILHDTLSEKNKPIIGIAANLDDYGVQLGLTYIRALYGVGALPVILCPTENEDEIAQTADRLDGILFAGGIDVFPEFYGDSFIHEKTECCKARDLFELALFKAFYERKKPILGICRGVQLINVALGGTLFQHIENHSGVTHNVNVSGHLLRLSGGKTPAVTNSTHHQALKKLGKDLEVIGLSDDGIIEGVCDFSDGRYLLGVQFHPEKSFPDDDFSRAIIRDFVNACSA